MLQSLVTVFDECIIANLTADYYVNCQKDMMWTSIPEQGSFGKENYRYAKAVMHPDDLQTFNDHFSRDAMLRRFGQGKKQISKRLRRKVSGGSYHMVEFTAAKIHKIGEEECWCVLSSGTYKTNTCWSSKESWENSQLATAAQIAYQMLISVNLTQNTYHMLEYDRNMVQKPGEAGCLTI